MEFDETKRVKVVYRETDKSIDYEFRPVNKTLKESDGLLGGTSLCIVHKPDQTILRIKRAEDEKLYPGYNSVPAGHMKVYNDGTCETPYETSLRELEEETKLKPLNSMQIFGEGLLIDPYTQLVGFAFLCPVDQNSILKYNEEINSKESGFERPETIMEKLKKEKFTPLSREIMTKFLNEIEVYGSLNNYLSNI